MTMNFELPADVEAARRAAREVADALLVHEPEFHRTGKVPPIVHKTLADLGYYGMRISETYGGSACDLLTMVAVITELARMPPQFYMSINGTSVIAQQLSHGSETQKQEWLPALASGKKIVAFGLTEPDCGSDVYAMRTTAVKKGDRYVLNGTKTYISYANVADVIVIFAYTDKNAGARGISSFLVPKGTRGLTIGAPIPTMGYTTEGLFEVILEDCEVPIEALLGEEGRGLEYAMGTVAEGRLTVGSISVGSGDIALESAMAYAKERKTFGVPVADHQVVQHMFADMTMDQHAARLVLMEATWRIQRGEDIRLKSSIVKVFCSEACSRTADKALQIFGGAGYCRGTVVERVYRDLRVLRILDGASEIQRNTIAKQIL